MQICTRSGANPESGGGHADAGINPSHDSGPVPVAELVDRDADHQAIIDLARKE